MTPNDLIKQLIISFNSNDNETFLDAAREYIEREKRMKHTQVAKELEKALFDKSTSNSFSERRFKSVQPIPRDSEKGFPLLEIKHYDESWESLILNGKIKEQLNQIIREFKDADVLATYNLSYKRKILLCGKPGTGKTFTAQIISSILHVPLVYVRFDAIVSSFLGETATNLRKVFDYIEQGTCIIFAATNHQNMLDFAIWRRFDDVVYYELPDETTRQTLFERFLRPMKRDNNIELKTLSERSARLSPSDIKMIAEEAMKLAIINESSILSMVDIS